MCEKVFAENLCRARSRTCGTFSESVFGGSTKHAALKPSRITALELGDRVYRKSSSYRSIGRGRLVATDGLLSWGHESLGKRWFAVGLSSGSWIRSYHDGIRRCRGSVVLQSALHSPIDQPFMVTEDSVLTHSSSTKGA